jgi:hypothetical protein
MNRIRLSYVTNIASNQLIIKHCVHRSAMLVNIVILKMLPRLLDYIVTLPYILLKLEAFEP